MIDILIKVLIFFILSYTLIRTVSSTTVRVQCGNNITVGELKSESHDFSYKNVSFVLKDTLGLSSVSQVRFSTIENGSSEDIIQMKVHPFIGAVHLAYSHHLRLVITPDIVWHLIATGISSYINQNDQELRRVFVDFEGKRKIKLRNDRFSLNDTKWDQVVNEFSESLNHVVKWDMLSLFDANFSSSTPESRIVSRIVLMDSVQKYLDYEFYSLCGIPEFLIHGEKNDWTNIRARIGQIKNKLVNLTVWLDQVDAVLENFELVYDNKVNKTFWNQIYKVQGGSGGPYLSGWSISLFPYLKDNEKNMFVWEKTWMDAYTNGFGGLTTADFRPTLSLVPFKWFYFGTEFELLFAGGLLGNKYNSEDKSIRSVFGYGVTNNREVS